MGVWVINQTGSMAVEVVWLNTVEECTVVSEEENCCIDREDGKCNGCKYIITKVYGLELRCQGPDTGLYLGEFKGAMVGEKLIKSFAEHIAIGVRAPFFIPEKVEE